jgi:hypothetical protein
MKFAIILGSLLSTSVFAGGVSGGGGNLINPTAPMQIQSPQEIKKVILSSKKLLKHFINTKFTQYKIGQMDQDSLRLYSVLFADNENNLHEVMEDISLDIQLNSPCYDSHGTAFDGSTYNQKLHSICISSYTIASKCTRSEIPAQATALILHEFSEVVGLSDEDAISLQASVLAEIK